MSEKFYTAFHLTSRCISCLFRFGDDEVGIENIERQRDFSKKRKQQRCNDAAPPAEEANVMNLKLH